MEAGMQPYGGGPASSPDLLPEIPGEISVLKGAIQSVVMRANELMEKLAPVSENRPEAASDEAMKISTELQITAPYALQIRESTEELFNLERRLERAYRKLEI